MNDIMTVTTSAPHGYNVGDRIVIQVRDTRWWRRLLFWLLRRGSPMTHRILRVTAADDNTLAAMKEHQ